MNLKDIIRTIPNFPKEGIMFRDITTLLQNPEAFRYVINTLYDRYKVMGISVVAAIESRGFIFGGALAYKLGASFVPLRKPGKLPWETERVEYELEYGKDSLEIHKDAVKKGDRVLIIDDLLATGGTGLAAAELIQKVGGEIVEFACIVNLPDLKGEERLKGLPVFYMTEFKGE